MSEQPKPRPARLPESDASAGSVKPTPARELGGLDAREPPAATRAGGGAAVAPAVEPDVAEVVLEVDGVAWRARVLGRSGGGGGRSPPLLLLGFFRGDAPDDPPAREATVVARALADLGPDRLEEALAESTPPPASDRPKPFFEGVAQGRRGGAARGDS